MDSDSKQPVPPLRWLQIVERCGRKSIVNLDNVLHILPGTCDAGLPATGFVFRQGIAPRTLKIEYEAVERVIARRNK